MKQSDLETLLNRPLTSSEVTNLKEYLKIANEQLKTLLCYQTGDEVRVYDSRPNYRSLFVEPFTEINSVKCDGVTVKPSEYLTKQWDSHSGEWKNVIEFKKPMGKNLISVDADWGFEGCEPADLRLLIAKLFDLVTKKYDGRVKNKSIERSFSVTYKDNTHYQQLLEDYASVIDKYSLCNLGIIRHGSYVRPIPA